MQSGKVYMQIEKAYMQSGKSIYAEHMINHMYDMYCN